MSSSISNSRAFSIAFMALFGLTTVGFTVGSELLIRFYAAPGDTYEIGRSAFHNSSAAYVAFGDSRAASGIPEDAGYDNFAGAGENLATTLGKLDAYVAFGRGRHVLLQLGPHNFSFYRLSLDQTDLLKDFLDPEPRVLQMLRPHYRRYLFDYWNAVLRDPGRLFAKHEAAPSEPKAEPGVADMSADEQRRQASIRTQLHIPVPGYAATAEMERLRATLKRTRDAGVTLCLVSFPVSSAYREAAGEFPVFAEIRADYAALAEELELTYIDLWDAYEDDNFSNVDHLNGRGARRLGVDLGGFCRGADS